MPKERAPFSPRWVRLRVRGAERREARKGATIIAHHGHDQAPLRHRSAYLMAAKAALGNVFGSYVVAIAFVNSTR
jgi:hypothetical protein